MIIKTFIFVGLLLTSLTSFADVYSGTVMYQSNRGPRPMLVTYKFDSSNKSNLKGVVEFQRENVGPCWAHPRSIDGSIIKGDTIILSAPPSLDHEALGCAIFEVVGKFEGDKIIGQFKQQGKLQEIVLSRQ